jgi:hypothetical protein
MRYIPMFYIYVPVCKSAFYREKFSCLHIQSEVGKGEANVGVISKTLGKSSCGFLVIV